MRSQFGDDDYPTVHAMITYSIHISFQEVNYASFRFSDSVSFLLIMRDEEVRNEPQMNEEKYVAGLKVETK